MNSSISSFTINNKLNPFRYLSVINYIVEIPLSPLWRTRIIVYLSNRSKSSFFNFDRDNQNNSGSIVLVARGREYNLIESTFRNFVHKSAAVSCRQLEKSIRALIIVSYFKFAYHVLSTVTSIGLLTFLQGSYVFLENHNVFIDLYFVWELGWFLKNFCTAPEFFMTYISFCYIAFCKIVHAKLPSKLMISHVFFLEYTINERLFLKQYFFHSKFAQYWIV